MNGRAVTDEMLELAIARVNLLAGPRFIAGDFNHDPDKLSAVAVLERMDFVDCQDLHMQRSGQHR